MKAVIIEIHKNIAVLLSEDGCINKIRNKNYTVGQEVEMNIKEKSNIGRAAVFAAAACFALILGFGGATYYTEAAYVSLDVNPSIEYGVNMYDRVISVKGVNDDGTEIIDRISLRELKNRKIKDAIALTVSEIASEGYLSADEAGIVIATSSGNTKKAEKMAQRLEKAATEVYDKNSGAPSVNAQAVGRDRVKQAKELGVTPGKLNLVERLKASAQEPESIDINEWLNKPVKDIIAQIKQNKELEKNKVKENQNAERKTKETTAPEEGATDAPEKTKAVHLQKPIISCLKKEERALPKRTEKTLLKKTPQIRKTMAIQDKITNPQ